MKKQTKDHNAPKRPLSAYFLYLADKRDSVKESISFARPELRKDKLFTETTIKLVEDWKNLSKDEKELYQLKSLIQKKEYDIKKAEYDKFLSNSK